MENLLSISYQLIICAIFLFVVKAEGSLHHAVHYYEVLKSSDIKHHPVRRSAEISGETHRRMTVSMMNNQFDLEMSSRHHLFHKEFKAFAVDKHGRKKEHKVDTEAFYTGTVRGIPNSEVKAHYDGEVLTAKIDTPDETYRIEPSWRHITDQPSFSMIAYKSSDVKKNSSAIFCPHDHHLPEALKYEPEYYLFEEETSKHTYADPHSRHKRAPPIINTCPLMLTADYRFYDRMGLRSMNITINYLISLIDRVDPIYRKTKWAEDYFGMGFEIKEIKVHTEPTAGDPKHYNKVMPNNEAWEVQALLEAYSREKHDLFCLAHLFTYQDFKKGVLGLAYIGTPRTNAVGGICSKPYHPRDGSQYLNTGLTTTFNWDRRVLTDEADLVTAHELGHNFGSEHDPGTENADCSPNSAGGGKFLMYPASVTGSQGNNKKFSVCSRHLILPVLKSKSPICFKEQSSTSWCGNYRVESGEECDGGHLGRNNLDPCCDPSCRLKPQATCSDQNSICCKNCQYAPKSKICREAFDNDVDCLSTQNCTGRSSECPLSLPKEDNSTCLDNGMCRGGTCVPFCESRGLQSCICVGEDACYRCCQLADGVCAPFINRTTEEDKIFSPNGRPCPEGICVEGKCESQTQDLIARLFDVFDDITIHVLTRIIKDNVVGATIFLSLLVWIPCSCLVHYYDKKREKEMQEVDSWLSLGNTERILPADKAKIRRQDRIRYGRLHHESQGKVNIEMTTNL